MAMEDSLRDCWGVLTVARRLPVGNKPGCTLHRLNRLRAATSAKAALLKSIGIVYSFHCPAIIVLSRPGCNHPFWAGPAPLTSDVYHREDAKDAQIMAHINN